MNAEKILRIRLLGQEIPVPEGTTLRDLIERGVVGPAAEVYDDDAKAWLSVEAWEKRSVVGADFWDHAIDEPAPSQAPPPDAFDDDGPTAVFSTSHLRLATSSGEAAAPVRPAEELVEPSGGEPTDEEVRSMLPQPSVDDVAPPPSPSAQILEFASFSSKAKPRRRAPVSLPEGVASPLETSPTGVRWSRVALIAVVAAICAGVWVWYVRYNAALPSSPAAVVLSKPATSRGAGPTPVARTGPSSASSSTSRSTPGRDDDADLQLRASIPTTLEAPADQDALENDMFVTLRHAGIDVQSVEASVSATSGTSVHPKVRAADVQVTLGEGRADQGVAALALIAGAYRQGGLMFDGLRLKSAKTVRVVDPTLALSYFDGKIEVDELLRRSREE